MTTMTTLKKVRLLHLYVSSCAAAFVFAALTGGEQGEYIPPSQSFAVVECPVSVSDREVAGTLHESGIQGVASESTQFFLLNAGNGVEQVPLDRLDDRLLAIDPRRDGYAEILRAFFVSEKTRRFFVPLSNWKNTSAPVIESAVRDALSGTPVSSIFIYQSPASPLSRVFGMAGKTAVLAALLIICGFFIPSFFKNFLSDRAYPDRKIRRGKTRVVVSLFLAAVFIASGMAGGVPSILRLAFVASPLLLFLLVWTLSAWFRWRAARRRGHILFRPVAMRGILPRSLKRRPPIIVICLFVIGALACAASLVTGSGGSGTAGFSGDGYGAIVSEEEYQAHGWRQTVFSHLPLGIGNEEDAPPYRRYAEDSGGLYVAAGTIDIDREERALPPYPFGSLAAFMEGTAVVATASAASFTAPFAGPVPGGILPFLIALAALLPFAILGTRHEYL